MAQHIKPQIEPLPLVCGNGFGLVAVSKEQPDLDRIVAVLLALAQAELERERPAEVGDRAA
jgi:hypothetical protein